MIKIISPEQFKKIPWKNGKGVTTELAISDGATMEEFDWRLSIASVVEDGAFSDFTGYSRNLILIAGNSVELHCDHSEIHRLDQLLSVASFDGGSRTFATLKAGPITDFNFISKAGKYDVSVHTYRDLNKVSLRASALCFIYCLNGTATLTSQDNDVRISLPAGHLMQLTKPDSNNLHVDGENMIVIDLDELKS